ncbi:hypothetical protein SEA_YOSIF_47 [Streptomyces phage Yosif]|uniref:Uncharacterized protein n=1 Tax=Streptomyces phage Yosif TaxID=2201421 RepID=A0A2Z4QBV1_9CAUD|nr:hypothetical protein KGG71_gp47 [Streptomyces phage Yosif]AWY07611.1 hypothetical protein SEA_YOSIF_47 [Streptomyces phage Yosif]
MNIIEISNAYESAEQATADWSWYEPDGEVDKVIQRAARTIGQKYQDSGTTEYDDAYQDALVMVATRRSLRAALGEPGLLYSRLVQDLTDKNKATALNRQAAKLTSWEDNQAKLERQGY